jgi:hypothetical protein
MKSDFVKHYDPSRKVVLYQLLYHCELMYDYLTEMGKAVPEWISKELAGISMKVIPVKTKYERLKKQGELTPVQELEFSEEISECIGNDTDKASLINMFNKLTELCAPSTPCTLENTIPTEKLFFKAGPQFVRFIRDMWLLALFCLVAYLFFIAIDFENPTLKAIVYQSLLFFSAGLGACFFVLLKSKSYIVARTFNNSYITHYYNRLFVGVIAGIILANLIKENFNPELFDSESPILKQLTPSVIALLGGFSCDLVVRILNRILAMLTTLVEGDAQSIIESRELEIKNKLNTQKLNQNLQNIDTLYTIIQSDKIDDALKTKLKEIADTMLKPL